MSPRYGSHERHLIREARDSLTLLLKSDTARTGLSEHERQALLITFAALDREFKEAVKGADQWRTSSQWPT